MPPLTHQKGELDAILRGLGLSPAAFRALIEEAIRNAWSPEQFEARIYLSKPFQRAFPGIVRGDGSLRMTPLEYRQVADAYKKVGSNYGIPLDTKRIGLLIEGNKSPQEFASVARVFKAAENTEGFRQAFNAQLVEAGFKPLDKRGWFETLAGKAPAEVNDMYEASVLKTAGVGGTTQELRAAAETLGQPGEDIDIAAVVQDFQKQKTYAATELAAAGITDADLVTLAGGNDPKGQRQTVEQIARNRQALANRGTRSTRTTPSGRPALYGEAQES